VISPPHREGYSFTDHFGCLDLGEGKAVFFGESISGKKRRVVIWRTVDGGSTWEELPLRVLFWQKPFPRFWASWPPSVETGSIRKLAIERGEIVIYYEDPWIDWERGSQWKAAFDERRRRWRMTHIKSE
jgi:hypothetical protein